MRLKTFTTGLLIFGVALFFGFPFLLKANPDLKYRDNKDFVQLDQNGDPILDRNGNIAHKDEEGNIVTVLNEDGEPMRLSASRREKAEFAIPVGGYIILMFAVWIAVIICSLLIVRRVRKELIAETSANMDAFVEGTLRDHAKKFGKDPEPIKELDDEGPGDDER